MTVLFAPKVAPIGYLVGCPCATPTPAEITHGADARELLDDLTHRPDTALHAPRADCDGQPTITPVFPDTMPSLLASDDSARTLLRVLGYDPHRRQVNVSAEQFTAALTATDPSCVPASEQARMERLRHISSWASDHGVPVAWA